MRKNYHEHCTEEHEEALTALAHAQTKTAGNITISYVLSNTRSPTISVPPHRIEKVLAQLKAAGRKILTVNGQSYYG